MLYVTLYLAECLNFFIFRTGLILLIKEQPLKNLCYYTFY